MNSAEKDHLYDLLEDAGNGDPILVEDVRWMDNLKELYPQEYQQVVDDVDDC